MIQNPAAIASDIRKKLSFLAHDMRTFSTNGKAESRLSTSIWPHGVGPPYLAEDKVDVALSLTLSELRSPARVPRTQVDPIGNLTLSEFITKEVEKVIAGRRQKQTSNDVDFVLCTSHNLAPIIQEALGLEKGYHESKSFKKGYKAWEKSLEKNLANK